jgi:hypothetical protein
MQLKHRQKYKVTINSKHKQPMFNNVLDRKFDVQKPDKAHVGGIIC